MCEEVASYCTGGSKCSPDGQPAKYGKVSIIRCLNGHTYSTTTCDC
ncbi:hypothetical protein L3i20_v244310 [Paenibacillus sp. L3-i20]|nr:hypothetical protein L3i20_v244310 [Paenibacillus sp. L3-i20]